MGEERAPQRVVDTAVDERDGSEQQRVERHHDRRDPLREPVEEPVMRADRVSPGHHSFAADDQRQREADDEHDHARPARWREIHADVHVEQQVADPGAEMVEEGPGEPEQHELRERMRERRAQRGVRIRRSEARLDAGEQQRNAEDEQERARDPMQERDDARQRHPDPEQVQIDRPRGRLRTISGGHGYRRGGCAKRRGRRGLRQTARHSDNASARFAQDRGETNVDGTGAQFPAPR